MPTPSMNTMELDQGGLLAACPHCGQRNRMTYERLGETFRCGKCHSDLAAPNAPISVSTEAQFDALTRRSSLPVLVDFWAPWCGPCKMVAPELEKVAAQGTGRWLVAKVNSEELPGLAQRYRISGIPTFVVFRGGQEVGRQSGAMPASRIAQLIEPFVAVRG